MEKMTTQDKERLISLIEKLPNKIDPINLWEPNPKYNEETKGKVKSIIHTTVQNKMINLKDIINLINKL